MSDSLVQCIFISIINAKYSMMNNNIEMLKAGSDPALETLPHSPSSESKVIESSKGKASHSCKPGLAVGLKSTSVKDQLSDFRPVT